MKKLKLNKTVAVKNNIEKARTELPGANRVGLHSKYLFKFSELLNQ